MALTVRTSASRLAKIRLELLVTGSFMFRSANGSTCMRKTDLPVVAGGFRLLVRLLGGIVRPLQLAELHQLFRDLFGIKSIRHKVTVAPAINNG